MVTELEVKHLNDYYAFAKLFSPVLTPPPLLPPFRYCTLDTIHCEAAAISDHYNDVADEPGDLSASGANSTSIINDVDSRNDESGETETETFTGVHVSCLPICEANSTYVRDQREAFLKGSPPPMFAAAAGGEDRRVESGFEGRASMEELTRGGRRSMGVWRYNKEHHNPALDAHHRLLHIPYEW